MRIFVYPSAADCANLGDLAMLQIAMERLKALWPDASFSILMRVPAEFEVHFPGAKPVPMRGCKCCLKRKDCSTRQRGAVLKTTTSICSRTSSEKKTYPR